MSALVLHVCGASRDAIVADYTASNEWGCSIEGRYIMEQMMPARLAGLFELDPWCEAPPAFFCPTSPSCVPPVRHAAALTTHTGTRPHPTVRTREVGPLWWVCGVKETLAYLLLEPSELREELPHNLQQAVR